MANQLADLEASGDELGQCRVRGRPATTDATSRRSGGPSVTPSIPWPVANTIPFDEPITGRPSGVHGPQAAPVSRGRRARRGPPRPRGRSRARGGRRRTRRGRRAGARRHAGAVGHRVGDDALVVEVEGHPRRRGRGDPTRPRSPCRPGAGAARRRCARAGPTTRPRRPRPRRRAAGRAWSRRRPRPPRVGLGARAQAHAAGLGGGADRRRQPRGVAARLAGEQHRRAHRPRSAPARARAPRRRSAPARRACGPSPRRPRPRRAPPRRRRVHGQAAGSS